MIPKLPKTVADNIEHFTGRTWLLQPLSKWIEQSDNRIFMLQGEPGTGKSSIIAWIAGPGPLPADADAILQYERIRSRVKAIHFCQANSGSISPKAFAQNIAEQLTRTVNGFSEILISTLTNTVTVASIQNISKMEANSTVTGVNIERLDLSGLSEEFAFDIAFREPLQELYKGDYDETILLLVDALDEAMTYTGIVNIVQLLAKLNDLPDQIRFLVTTRPDERVLALHHQVKPFDLIADAPVDLDDVRLYVHERLGAVEGEQGNWIADRISRAADGNFLYAHFVLTNLIPHLPEITNFEAMPLPEGLKGLYHDFLTREIGANRKRWFNTFRPVLGLIAVAQGEGLSRNHIESITGQEIDEALEVCMQYLASDSSEGPFRVFHKSFADFLLEDESNKAYHIDPVRMHRSIVLYYQRQYSSRWPEMDRYGIENLWTHMLGCDTENKLLECTDNYAVQHLFHHMLQAGRVSDVGKIVDLIL